MAHGKAVGQYRVIPNGFVWDVVNGLGEVVCWSHDTFYEAIKHAIMLNLRETN